MNGRPKKKPRFPVPIPEATKGPLVAAAYGAASLGLLSIVLLWPGFVSLGNIVLEVSILLALLGMFVSLVCLVAAAVGDRKATRPSLLRMRWVLPVPFVTSLPALFFGALGSGLGGDTATSNLLLTTLIVSVILIPIVIISAGLLQRRERPEE
jgi:hypothetical protein